MIRKHEPDVKLAETFAQVARSLLAEPDVNRTLDRICKLAVETVGGCEAAGVSLISRRISPLTATDGLRSKLVELQSEVGQDPDPIQNQEVFIMGSLSEEPRWPPEFSLRADEETGVRSVLSLRLFASGETMGALNLYSRRPDAFDDRDVAVGSVFAVHAAVALTSARHDECLEKKAASRDVIGMAKGIVMARQRVSDAQAFDILRRASQRMNVKLRDLAQQVVDRSRGEANETDDVPGV